MSLNTTLPTSNTQIFDRDRVLLLLRTGMEKGAFRFTRQTALAWLSAYPGDLEVNLWYVKALAKEERYQQALPIIEKIVQTDPEYLDALLTADHLFSDADAQKSRIYRGMIQALGGAPSNAAGLPAWGPAIFLARKALQNQNYEQALAITMGVLADPDNPILGGICHLEITEKTSDPQTTLNLAKVYHDRWPDCLQVSLIFARTLLASGQEESAVSLLHECAAHDLAAQVPSRLWGATFEFKPLYPDRMEIPASFAIPAEISGPLGMNVLGAGAVENQTHKSAPAEEVRSFDGYKVKQDAPKITSQSKDNVSSVERIKDEVLLNIEKEFKKVAEHLKAPETTQKDSRFPVYVILSTKTGLEKQYGVESTKVITSELNTLAEDIRKRNGWDALVFYPDDLEMCGKYGTNPIDAIDPWKIKLALADLDNGLVKKGEMIGSVLIIGGDKVVPFHRLPNPTDDDDAEVPSDNPYATLDSNYFVADWPVGRIPGEAGSDSSLLIEEIRNTQQYHTDEQDAETWFNKLIRLLFFWDKTWARQFANAGYTAAIWQRSSLAAFHPLGEGRNLYLSPARTTGDGFDIKKIASAPFSYFNLHGVSDGSDWYGQKDPAGDPLGSDFPVALKAADVFKLNNISKLIYSEACYGGHVLDKSESQSMALTMLGLGALGMVASTTISYGSVSTPLIGADLLGNLLMRNLRDGKTLGEAFMNAKLDFVKEMNDRQGYLDGEDQKTLISFVLFGDPLVAYDPYQAMKKTINRDTSHLEVKTVSDRMEMDTKNIPVNQEIISRAKKMVNEYLPGIEYAEVRISRQIIKSEANGHSTQTMNTQRQGRSISRTVVTFRKEVNAAEKTYRQYARVTLDQKGKMIKLAVSR